MSAVFYKRTSSIRSKLNYAALAISTMYLGFSFINQQVASKAFEQSLSQKDIQYVSYINKATPLNILLWSITVKTEKGYYFGYYSLFDKAGQIEFDFMPANHYLLDKYRGHEKLERLLEITKGYYTVEESKEGNIIINDLRFGQFNGWQKNGDGTFVFEYHISEDSNNELSFEQRNYRFMPDKDYLLAYVNRIAGKTQ
jgi:inner membrane protein